MCVENISPKFTLNKIKYKNNTCVNIVIFHQFKENTRIIEKILPKHLLDKIRCQKVYKKC